jgi:FHA domain-containing protein
MIVITAESLNGAPMEALSAAFDELGGTIGRAPTNQLVLPDPHRSVSRIHARIVYRNGDYAVLDLGSNPVLVNGEPLGNGREAPIREGDTLHVGDYVLRVSRGNKAAAADPFADLFGTPPQRASAAPSAPSAPSATAASAAPSARAAAAPAPSWPASPAAARPAPPPAASAIPDDWNPFAPVPSRAAPPSIPDEHTNPYIRDLPVASPAREQSLDSLFDLGPDGGRADPWPGNVPPARSSAPSSGTPTDDPLEALFGGPPPAAPTVPDHASELQTPWMAPPLAQPAPPPGAVLSWDAPPRAGQVVMPTGPQAGAPSARPGPPAAPTQMPPAAAPARPRQAAAATAAAPDALARAFAEGLGLPEMADVPLDEARMRLIGQLLAEATRGAVELLQARAAVKREMRAEVTMIVARENNPLKFSPAVEVALRHLLGAPARGFLPPADAMRDAFDDLRAHQLGVMAGMRSALEGVLERFDPAVLESQLVRRSSLADLIPASRKSRLWELFQQLYGQLSKEAADDFDELFGKAFRRAYEAHIDQLRRDS